MLARTRLSCSVNTTGFFPRRSGRTLSTPRPSSSDCGLERGRVEGAAVFPQQPRGAAPQGPSASGDPSTLCPGLHRFRLINSIPF